MEAKVATCLVCILMVALASANDPISEVLNTLLVRPFCRRTAVKSVMDICVTSIPEIQTNTFCEDFVSAHKTGTARAADGNTANRVCSLTVFAQNSNIRVACKVGDPQFSIEDDYVAIYPLKTEWGKKLLINKGQPGYTIDGVFTGGATIVMSANSRVECSWLEIFD